MANTIVRKVWINNDSTAVGSNVYRIDFTITGDGSGDEVNTRVNSTSGDLGLNPQIIAIHGAATGCSARLLWDATSPDFCYQIPADFLVDKDFKLGNGINNRGSAGNTGNLVITTSGLGLGDSIFLRLDFRKK